MIKKRIKVAIATAADVSKRFEKKEVLSDKSELPAGKYFALQSIHKNGTFSTYRWNTSLSGLHVDLDNITVLIFMRVLL